MRSHKRVYRGRRFWEKAVREWRSSGQSQREFAKSRGVAASTLSKWAGRLGAREEPGDAMPAVLAQKFIEIASGEAPVVLNAGDPAVRLMVGGAVAEFGRLPPPEYLAAVGLYTERGRC